MSLLGLAGVSGFGLVVFVWAFLVTANPTPRWLVPVAVVDVVALAVWVPALRIPAVVAAVLGGALGLLVGLMHAIGQAIATMYDEP